MEFNKCVIQDTKIVDICTVGSLNIILLSFSRLHIYMLIRKTD